MPERVPKAPHRTHKNSLWWLLACVAVLGGCAFAGDAPVFEEKPYVFADAAGIVYLTSLGSSHDVHPPSWFRRWIIGRDAYDDNKVILKPYGVAAGKGKVYINDGQGSSGYWILTLADMRLQLVRERVLGGSTGLAVDEREYKYFAVPRLVDAKARGALGTEEEKGRVVAFDDHNELVKWVDIPGRPVGIAVSGGRLFVTDVVNHRVTVLDKHSLEEVGHFGEFGAGDSEFQYPRAITAGSDGRIYVGDTLNGRIKIFNPDGGFVSQYGYRTPLLGSFLFLSGLAVDREGRVYAVDAGYRQKVSRDEVQILESANFYPNGEPVPPIQTALSERRNALYGYFQKPNAIDTSGPLPYRPTDVAVDYENVAYFQNLAPDDVRIVYLIWLTSQSAANGRNLSLFAFTVAK